MKKRFCLPLIVALLVALALCVGLCGCKSDENGLPMARYLEEIDQAATRTCERDRLALTSTIVIDVESKDKEPVHEERVVFGVNLFPTQYDPKTIKFDLMGHPVYCFDGLLFYYYEKTKTVEWGPIEQMPDELAQEMPGLGKDDFVENALFDLHDVEVARLSMDKNNSVIAYEITVRGLGGTLNEALGEEMGPLLEQTLQSLEIELPDSALFRVVVQDGLLKSETASLSVVVKDVKMTVSVRLDFEYDPSDVDIPQQVAVEYGLITHSLRFVERLVPAADDQSLALSPEPLVATDEGVDVFRYRPCAPEAPYSTTGRYCDGRFLVYKLCRKGESFAYYGVQVYDAQTTKLLYTLFFHRPVDVRLIGNGYLRVDIADDRTMGSEIYALADGAFVCRTDDEPLDVTERRLVVVQRDLAPAESTYTLKVIDRETDETQVVAVSSTSRQPEYPYTFVDSEHDVLFVGIAVYAHPCAYYGIDRKSGRLLYSGQCPTSLNWVYSEGKMLQAAGVGYQVDLVTGELLDYAVPSYPPTKWDDGTVYDVKSIESDFGRYEILRLRERNGGTYGFWLYDSWIGRYLSNLGGVATGRGYMVDGNTILLEGYLFRINADYFLQKEVDEVWNAVSQQEALRFDVSMIVAGELAPSLLNATIRQKGEYGPWARVQVEQKEYILWNDSVWAPSGDMWLPTDLDSLTADGSAVMSLDETLNLIQAGDFDLSYRLMCFRADEETLKYRYQFEANDWASLLGLIDGFDAEIASLKEELASSGYDVSISELYMELAVKRGQLTELNYGFTMAVARGAISSGNDNVLIGMIPVQLIMACDYPEECVLPSAMVELANDNARPLQQVPLCVKSARDTIRPTKEKPSQYTFVDGVEVSVYNDKRDACVVGSRLWAVDYKTLRVYALPDMSAVDNLELNCAVSLKSLSPDLVALCLQGNTFEVYSAVSYRLLLRRNGTPLCADEHYVYYAKQGAGGLAVYRIARDTGAETPICRPQEIPSGYSVDGGVVLQDGRSAWRFDQDGSESYCVSLPLGGVWLNTVDSLVNVEQGKRLDFVTGIVGDRDRCDYVIPEGKGTVLGCLAVMDGLDVIRLDVTGVGARHFVYNRTTDTLGRQLPVTCTQYVYLDQHYFVGIASGKIIVVWH